jgi:hypothetical protein
MRAEEAGIRAAAGGSRPVCLAGVRRDERKGKEKISVSRDIHHFMSCIFSLWHPPSVLPVSREVVFFS